jgi:hypothetical protein
MKATIDVGGQKMYADVSHAVPDAQGNTITAFLRNADGTIMEAGIWNGHWAVRTIVQPHTVYFK